MFPELQHYINSDDDAEVPVHRDYMINNDEDAISNDPCILTRPINHDFSCTEFGIDGIFDSDETISHDAINDEVPVLPPPSELPSACVPEITFTSTSKVLKELRSIPSTRYLDCNALSLGLQQLLNLNHVCDYGVEANSF